MTAAKPTTVVTIISAAAVSVQNIPSFWYAWSGLQPQNHLKRIGIPITVNKAIEAATPATSPRTADKILARGSLTQTPQ
jgi:hypothetical protein